MKHLEALKPDLIPLQIFTKRAYSGSMKLPNQLNATRTDFPTLGLFALASLATVALGSAGLALGGAASGSWVRNPAAWLAGLGIAGSIVAAGRSAAVSRGAILLTLVALAATFLSPAQSGVQRWIDAGPLHINIAALLLPLAIVALATAQLAAPLFLAAVAATGLLLVAQPDASQATAFLLVAGFLVLRGGMPRATKIAGALGIAALTIAAWLRPDPLEPVPEVEGIFALLAAVSPALAGLAGVGIAITALIPLRRAATAEERTAEAAKALVLYFAAVAIAPAAGVFPVPLVGLGMSFPVGYWMGMALLCARARQRAPQKANRGSRARSA